MFKAIILFLLLFTLDNIIVIIFPIQPLFGSFIIVPYLVLIGLCFYVFYDEKNYAPWLAFAFGLVYDMYGANLLGIYSTLFPIIVIVIKKFIVPVTPVNFVSMFYIITIEILIVEIVLFSLVRLITNRTMPIFTFVQYRLITTLVFNSIILLFLYGPLIKIFKLQLGKKSKLS